MPGKTKLRFFLIVFKLLLFFWIDTRSILLASSIDGSPLSIHENNFLLIGAEDSPYSKNIVFKFQLSAKLKILESPFYFAYTQRSFMDVASYSFPFYDHNYRPEFFYVQGIAGKKILKALQLGVLHSSNGKGEDSSRGWNYVYLKLYFKSGRAYFEPKFIVALLLDQDNNPDLRQYYGALKLNLGYRWPNNVEWSASVYPGIQFDKYSVETNFNIPWKVIFKKLDEKTITSLWFHAYHGFGETLLGYNQITQSISLGFGIRG
ncbi:MAG TPA: phospholipase A [Oligoflexia bacterium]|nr:phospholipase A [Oligoflexia bacterium]HMR24796.1 phospholipase A [Oligoflexia bacterium]